MLSSQSTSDVSVCIVIPCYNVERTIKDVVMGIPSWVDHIVLVNDASTDQTGKCLEELRHSHPQVQIVTHAKNAGVGGAVKSGMTRGCDLGATVLVKLDGDGQMDPAYLNDLIYPIVHQQANYTKGNRFTYGNSTRTMPIVRRIGNLSLGFLIKAASGYWTIFDPTNGYTAISSKVFRMLRLDKLDNRYFFESSVLCELRYLNAVVKDIPMQAKYGEEVSNLSISNTLLKFPFLLARRFIRRILFHNFIYDFSMLTIYLTLGLTSLTAGIVYGLAQWQHYSSINQAAPTGTVMIASLLVIFGVQLLLSATSMDVENTPRIPLNNGIGEATPYTAKGKSTAAKTDHSIAS